MEYYICHSWDSTKGIKIAEGEYYINGEINNQAVMKPNLSWIDLFCDGLPHQSTFIKRSLFDKFGLYDESSYERIRSHKLTAILLSYIDEIAKRLERKRKP